MDELEAQLQSKEADLKSAQKRIEQLHGALKDHEEYSGDEEDLDRSRDDSLDNLSSAGSSYSLGDGGSLDFSDDDEEEIVAPKTSRSLDRNRGRGVIKEQSPVVDYKPRRRVSREEEEEDEFEASRKARQRRLQQLEEEEDQLEASRRARKERLKELDNDFDSSRKARQKRLQDLEEEEASSKPRSKDSSGSFTSSKYSKKTYEDEDDDDDEDLEEFFRKQKERMKKLVDSDEGEEEERSSTLRATRRKQSEDSAGTTSPVPNGKANGVHSSKSREQSEEPQRRDSVDNVTSRQRRKRQRRRTIEQLASPEHQAAKSNGVNL